MQRAIWRTAVVASALGLAGCLGVDGPTTPTCPVVQIPALAGDTVVSETGLRYITRQNGTGAAATANSDVAVLYAGYLEDGTRFDRTGAQPAVFSLTQVIPGFREGITGMREGGSRRLIIPADLAYGSSPQRCIPANSTLIFDVDLVQTAARN